MTRLKRLLILSGLLGLTILISMIVVNVNGSSTTKLDTTQDNSAAAVEVIPAQTRRIAEIVSGVGMVSAQHDVTVSSETAGRITKVLTEVGDRVKVGQPLLVVDDELKALAVEQAKAQLLAAETNSTKAKKDFQRTENLYRTGDVSEFELDNARLAYHSAQSQYESARVAHKVAERQLADTQIKSPVDGYVAARFVELGEMVDPGKRIANIVDVSSIKVKIGVAEENIVKVRKGQKVRLTVDVYPNTIFEGTVLSVGDKSDSPLSHQYPVEVLLSNSRQHPLKVGMFARVEINAADFADAVVIPKQALLGDASHQQVYVVRNGVVSLRDVTVGVRYNGDVQILNGLEDGELVVTMGQSLIKDGSPVRFGQAR